MIDRLSHDLVAFEKKMIERFYLAIERDMEMTLATADADSVTMRTVSPVRMGRDILFFTSVYSTKHKQLTANKNCCIMAGGLFARATAEFRGATMDDANGELREIYTTKFPDAFDEDVPLGGRHAEFIVLTPSRLTGWAFANDEPTADGVPTVPIDIELKTNENKG